MKMHTFYVYVCRYVLEILSGLMCVLPVYLGQPGGGGSRKRTPLVQVKDGSGFESNVGYVCLWRHRKIYAN